MTSRYDRQTRVDGWKQDKLKSATVAVIGCGALGNFISPILAAYGIGRIIVIDDDTVELHNLARQIMFEESDVNEYKATALESSLKKLNSDIQIEALVERIDEDNIEFLLSGVTVIADCVDNITARYILNKFALQNDIPLVHMGSSPSGGEVAVITRKTACLQCFMKMNIDDDDSCTDVVDPSIAETNAVIASIGASQIRTLIMPIQGEKLIEPTLYYHRLKRPIPFTHIPHKKRKDCEICSKGL